MPPRSHTIQARTADAAERLAQRGLWVVLCPDNHTCTTPEWQKVRCDIKLVKDIIKSFPRWPIGIGIVLNQSPFLDVECDSPQAESDLHRLCGSLPQTPTWQSRRGKHRLFVRPDGPIPDKAQVLIDAIEVRGCSTSKGSMSVVPPSARRSWLPGLSLDDLDPAPLPEPLTERLRWQAASRARRKRRSPSIPPKGDGIHTFFQWLMSRVFGPPLTSRADGYALWPCPFCRQETLHSRLTSRVFKDRFQCWACDWHGDAADVLAFHNPDKYGPGKYGQACLALGVMRQEYERFRRAGGEP